LTPEPELDKFGSNLPTIISFYRDKHNKVFKSLESRLKSIIPELERINIEYVFTKKYGLFFKEKKIKKPWGVDDISDGTIQVLAILAAILDPRSKLTIIEEPENSVHSWIVSHILEACREAAEDKYILLTTHSINLIDKLSPEELYLAYKHNGETKVIPAEAVDVDLRNILEKGISTLGEYIYSGGIQKAVPPGE